MKHLAAITDKDITGSDALSTTEPRIAVTAVLFDRDCNIALSYSSKMDIYSIIGGGVDLGEDLITAIKREILEEAGCHCEIICELGLTFESRAEINYTQTRYNYIARVVGEKGELQLTEDELSKDITVRWLPIEEALRLIKKSTPHDYNYKFIRHRDIIVLNEVLTNHAHLIGDSQ